MTTHRGLLHHMTIRVSDVARSSPFYSRLFLYLGYTLGDSRYDKAYAFEDWRRQDLETPHEISICQAAPALQSVRYQRGAVGHHDHIAFCARDREDVDRFHSEVLIPLAGQGLCHIEDTPCECPEYGSGYYATFFLDPDGLKYEFVFKPRKRE